jgi:hypothetical protein
MLLENQQGVKGALGLLYSYLPDFQTFSFYFSREQKEKQEAKDRYWKVSFYLLICHPWLLLIIYFVQLHVQGKTDEAKADLSRLAKIRAEREAAQAKRIAEAEGKHTLRLLLSLPDLTRY